MLCGMLWVGCLTPLHRYQTAAPRKIGVYFPYPSLRRFWGMKSPVYCPFHQVVGAPWWQSAP